MTTLREHNELEASPGQSNILYCATTGEPVCCGTADDPRETFHGAEILAGQWVFTVTKVFSPDYPAPPELDNYECMHECLNNYVFWRLESANTCVLHYNGLSHNLSLDSVGIPTPSMNAVIDLSNNSTPKKNSAWDFTAVKLEIFSDK